MGGREAGCLGKGPPLVWCGVCVGACLGGWRREDLVGGLGKGRSGDMLGGVGRGRSGDLVLDKGGGEGVDGCVRRG